jgi:hypothetical protein
MDTAPASQVANNDDVNNIEQTPAQSYPLLEPLIAVKPRLGISKATVEPRCRCPPITMR